MGELNYLTFCGAQPFRPRVTAHRHIRWGLLVDGRPFDPPIRLPKDTLSVTDGHADCLTRLRDVKYFLNHKDLFAPFFNDLFAMIFESTDEFCNTCNDRVVLLNPKMSESRERPRHGPIYMSAVVRWNVRLAILSANFWPLHVMEFVSPYVSLTTCISSSGRSYAVWVIIADCSGCIWEIEKQINFSHIVVQETIHAVCNRMILNNAKQMNYLGFRWVGEVELAFRSGHNLGVYFLQFFSGVSVSDENKRSECIQILPRTGTHIPDIALDRISKNRIV